MFKVLGINDEVTTCDCCGKTNLKCTVALESEATGIVRYGRDCAAKAVMGNKSRSNATHIEKVAKAVSYARKWIAARPEKATDSSYLNQIANHIRVYWCNASALTGRLVIDGVELT